MSEDDERTPISAREAYDGHYWRQRATMTREEAQAASTESERDRLIKVAAEYEKLALRADNISNENITDFLGMLHNPSLEPET